MFPVSSSTSPRARYWRLLIRGEGGGHKSCWLSQPDRAPRCPMLSLVPDPGQERGKANSTMWEVVLLHALLSPLPGLLLPCHLPFGQPLQK